MMKFRDFNLDEFQEKAIVAIEENNSVMVSAPTGSGKTLIADYIIDRDIQENKRVIYTAPIKALSNQKYKDFVEQYGEDKIGLITGDIVINSRAEVLVMTTEIYRNMAVIKDPVLDNVSYCIFDEIHYINDPERGYIWEESIIFSPSQIRFLFLSATVPNAKEFAGWVQKIKKHKVLVIEHDERPVPLERLFYEPATGITTLKAIQELQHIPEYRSARGSRYSSRQQVQKNPDYIELITELRRMEKLPCIYFVFSRSKTQDYAVKISRKFDLLSQEEHAVMSREIADQFTRISSEVGGLKSTQDVRLCLSKGIGFHHAGLLPDVKHIIEHLFAMGLVKVLFATETFAVGINMPAKTVCFDSLRKFTGEGFRYINSKEYFQISGRAGRRGKDKTGLSIAIVHRGDDLKRISQFTNKDTMPIRSQFKLTYNTVLNMVNLHKPEEIEHLLRMNFYTYQEWKNKKGVSAIKARYKRLMQILHRFEYIKDNTLTELGIFTTKVFSDELEMSQIFATSMKENIDEYLIMLILGALVYEQKKDHEFFQSYPSKGMSRFQERIRAHPILKRRKWFENMERVSALVGPVFERKKFLDILKNTTMPEGDCIRFFMQMLDKLEQIDRATVDEELIAKVRNVKDLIRDSLVGIHVF